MAKPVLELRCPHMLQDCHRHSATSAAGGAAAHTGAQGAHALLSDSLGAGSSASLRSGSAGALIGFSNIINTNTNGTNTTSMPLDGDDEYDLVVGGKLKLKGVSLKKTHKKKKKKRSRCGRGEECGPRDATARRP